VENGHYDALEEEEARLGVFDEVCVYTQPSQKVCPQDGSIFSLSSLVDLCYYKFSSFSRSLQVEVRYFKLMLSFLFFFFLDGLDTLACSHSE
jgi:hypothetical protein